eukprot:GILJ01027333.1.p1 GENE.GILJ01027333.1~~GILJ01027333.1.p1  ORF type:complete len:251 (+),score=46.26 GILJ01027333.1:267-1019(+)
MQKYYLGLFLTINLHAIRAAATVAPLFIVFWIGMVILVLANMFIAIVSGFFNKIKSKQRIEHNIMGHYAEQPLAVDMFDSVSQFLAKKVAQVKACFSSSRKELYRAKPWQNKNPRKLLKRHTIADLTRRLDSNALPTTPKTPRAVELTEEEEKQYQDVLWNGLNEAELTVLRMLDGDDLFSVLQRSEFELHDVSISVEEWSAMLKKINAKDFITAYNKLRPLLENSAAGVGAYEEPFEVCRESNTYAQTE